MVATLPGPVMVMLAELEQVTAAVLEKHFALAEGADRTDGGGTVEDWAPFGIYITSHEEILASFVEEGVDLDPRKKIVGV